MQVSAGGSLSNSLVALARLGIAGHNRRGGEPLRVGMLSVCGDDALVRVLPCTCKGPLISVCSTGHE